MRTGSQRGCVNAGAVAYLEQLAQGCEDLVRRKRLRVAAESLRRFPLRVACGEAAKDLAGVGDWIAARLDEYLRSQPAPRTPQRAGGGGGAGAARELPTPLREMLSQLPAQPPAPRPALDGLPGNREGGAPPGSKPSKQPPPQQQQQPQPQPQQQQHPSQQPPRTVLRMQAGPPSAAAPGAAGPPPSGAARGTFPAAAAGRPGAAPRGRALPAAVSADYINGLPLPVLRAQCKELTLLASGSKGAVAERLLAYYRRAGVRVAEGAAAGEPPATAAAAPAAAAPQQPARPRAHEGPPAPSAAELTDGGRLAALRYRSASYAFLLALRERQQRGDGSPGWEEAGSAVPEPELLEAAQRYTSTKLEPARRQWMTRDRKDFFTGGLVSLTKTLIKQHGLVRRLPGQPPSYALTARGEEHAAHLWRLQQRWDAQEARGAAADGQPAPKRQRLSAGRWTASPQPQPALRSSGGGPQPAAPQGTPAQGAAAQPEGGGYSSIDRIIRFYRNPSPVAPPAAGPAPPTAPAGSGEGPSISPPRPRPPPQQPSPVLPPALPPPARRRSSGKRRPAPRSSGGAAQGRAAPGRAAQRADWRELVADPAPQHRAAGAAGELRVVLLVDHRERYRGSRRAFLERLEKRRVACETRQLPLGDFLWVARDAADPGAEVLLDLIVERKRASDLASSIVTGRYDDQKRRIRACGLRRPVYLLEGSCEEQRLLPAQSLQSALCTTALFDGISIEQTQGIDATCAWLAAVTRQLQAAVGRHSCLEALQRAHAVGPAAAAPFDPAPPTAAEEGLPDYAEWAAADRCAREERAERNQFPLMLACAHGCSMEAGAAIAAAYGSAVALGNTYQRLLGEGRAATAELALSAVPVSGGGGKRVRFVGDAVSSLIFKTFAAERYED